MKKVSIIGIGALGTRVASALCKEKCRLILFDRDVVEQSNLKTQGLYNKFDIGLPKAFAAAKKLGKRGACHCIDIDHDTIRVLKGADLVIDCTDNLYTRQLINEYCKKTRKPWIFGAVSKKKGMVKLFVPERECFYCVFSNAESSEDCTLGVDIAMLDKVAGTQAALAKAFLGKHPVHPLIICRGKKVESISTKKREGCRVCKRRYPYLQGQFSRMRRFCGQNTYEFRLKIPPKLLKGKPFLKMEKATIFRDGRCLVNASNDREARRVFTKVLDAN